MRIGIVVLAVAALSVGCATQWLQFEQVPQQHKVRAGESLHQLAFRYRLDPRALAQWNGIGRDARIYAGLDLRLRPPLPGQLHPVHGAGTSTAARTPPATRGYAPAPATQKPATKPAPKPPTPSAVGATRPAPASGGKTAWRWPLRGEVIRRFGNGNDGIDIATEKGSPVTASAAGRVVYGGSALKGYGLLLIIQHEGDWMSAYGHTAELLVGEGDQVRAGQVIARSGLGPGQVPLLHFETRRQGQPVDPLRYLPRG